MPSPHEEVTDKKQPRRQFRKERKREARKARRQLYAQARDHRLEQNEDEQLKQHSEYLQQKRLWEEREQRYELINAVRKKAEQAELQAREAAKVTEIYIVGSREDSTYHCAAKVARCIVAYAATGTREQTTANHPHAKLCSQQRQDDGRNRLAITYPFVTI
ncbi:hypothetical protein BJV82DRAFT_378965 [Fennellomyces sp. T-0311]|nr:hypothetical protein BJV82DRAFT_378965 [Fennellomyces sp. T-0311]